MYVLSGKNTKNFKTSPRLFIFPDDQILLQIPWMGVARTYLRREIYEQLPIVLPTSTARESVSVISIAWSSSKLSWREAVCRMVSIQTDLAGLLYFLLKCQLLKTVCKHSKTFYIDFGQLK